MLKKLFIYALGIFSLVWIFSPVSVKCQNILVKCKTYFQGVLFLIVCKDFKWEKVEDSDNILKREIKTKRVIFIRHGESNWNSFFNKGFCLSAMISLLKGILSEILFLTSKDSLFIDSSLNRTGLEQAKTLREKILEKSSSSQSLDFSTIRDEEGTDSVIVSSNLRRAIQTLAIAFQDRLEVKKEKIFVLSSLQEISVNIDCLALTKKNIKPLLSKETLEYFPTYDSNLYLNAEENNGSKDIFSNGLMRMSTFCNWVFSRNETIIIVGGHSNWFRSFFATYLPQACQHEAKKKKIENCGVVTFNLSCGVYNGKTMYRIDPESITLMYKSFQ